MDALRTWCIAVMIGFLLITVLIGWIAGRRVKSSSDFMVAGRGMGPWMVAFAYAAVTFSSSAFIGSAAMGYMWGAGIFAITAASMIIGKVTIWLVMGRGLRRISARLEAFTFSEFLAKRYQSPILQTITGAIVFLAMVVYSSAVLMGMSYVFEVFFGIPYFWGLVIMVVVTAFYLAAGGIVSTMWNTVFQALLMAVAVASFVVVFYTQVGFSSAYEAMAATRGLEYVSFPGAGGMALVGALFFFGLCAFAMPHSLHTFLTMKNSDVIRTSFPILVIWTFITLFGLYYIFSLSYQVLGPGIYPDKVMPGMMVKLLPAPLAALVAVAAIAATVSTLAGQALQSAFAIVRDIYQTRFSPKTSDAKITRIARIMCILVVLLALGLATPQLDLIIFVVGLSMAAMLGSFMSQVVLGLHWRRGTGTAAIWAMVLGFVVTMVWAALFGMKGEHLYYIHPSMPGVATNWVVFVVVSLISKPLPKEHLDQVLGTG